MKYNLFYNKNSFFLFFVYFLAIIIGLLIFKDYGIHIEEKYHRLNGHYWLNYICKIFNFTELQFLNDKIIPKKNYLAHGDLILSFKKLKN